MLNITGKIYIYIYIQVDRELFESLVALKDELLRNEEKLRGAALYRII